MRIIEVCPECGADIEHIEICTNPPIHVRHCIKCDWRYESAAEEVMRIPFHPEGVTDVVRSYCNFGNLNLRTGAGVKDHTGTEEEVRDAECQT